jgi:hypothetical protein
VVVLLFVNVLPHDVKSMLVFWKPRGWLPGCAAFTKYGPHDPRINMQTIEKKVGRLPTDPKRQNIVWYELFTQVEHEPEVSEVHSHFLMYRDMAVLSLPFVVVTPALLYFAGASFEARWCGAGFFAVQYLVTALSGNWSGKRLVSNVLAVYSAKGPKTKPTRRARAKQISAP